MTEAQLVEAILSGQPRCQWGIGWQRKHACDQYADWFVDFAGGQAVCNTHAKLQADSIFAHFRHIRTGKVVHAEAFEAAWKFARRLELAIQDW